jgi:hypothetical protein
MADPFKNNTGVVKNKPMGSTLGMAGHVAKSVGSGIVSSALSAHPMGRLVKSVYKTAVSAAQDYRKKTGGL